MARYAAIPATGAAVERAARSPDGPASIQGRATSEGGQGLADPEVGEGERVRVVDTYPDELDGPECPAAS